MNAQRHRICRSFAVVFFLILPVLAAACSYNRPLRLTYIANEGFMVEVGGTKILIDAFFGGLQGDWADQPDETTAGKLARAEPPFDDVDLIAISHRHSDHFSEQMVIQHLLSNPSVKVLWTT